MSFSDLSFWCYACDTYVKSSRFDKVHDHFYQQKFGDISKDDTLGLISKMTELNINKGTIPTLFLLLFDIISHKLHIDNEDDKTETNEETKSDPSASSNLFRINTYLNHIRSRYLDR